jgi:hypothetical protein
MAIDPETAAKLEAILKGIKGYPDPRRATREWTQAYKLLQKTDLIKASVDGVVGMRDVGGLDALIRELKEPPPADRPGDDVCHEALKAFRKRLELAILDEESKLGHSPLTKGKDATRITAIVPPKDWPEKVWKELARRCELRYVGHGLYELVE